MRFNLTSQQDGESVDHFATDLYCLAEYCEFERDDLIRERIVIGVKDKKLSEQLDSKLTSEKAIIIETKLSKTLSKETGSFPTGSQI